MSAQGQTYFNELADHVTAGLAAGEVALCRYQGESSDFVRFNHGRVRQAGHVDQHGVGVTLIRDGRQASAGASLAGEPTQDRAHLDDLVAGLRTRLPHVPEDPYLLYETAVHSSERHGEDTLPTPGDAVDQIRTAAGDDDLVGIYAAGSTAQGFANSLGQRNWSDAWSYNFNWSFYHQADKAVKSAYAGFAWDAPTFEDKVDLARRQLAALRRPAHTVDPGRYRVYLTPAALYEIIQMMAWGGFGLKAHRTKQTPLLRMVEAGARLDPRVTLRENTAEGVAPGFQEQGFQRPDAVTLIQEGGYAACLVSPRSAREYDVETNGASAAETPESYDIAAGGLDQGRALETLDTGIYVGNLWYLNFSDRTACRTTGMTRFATFWVENGEVVAPLNVMRFDETVYRVLGDNLVDLTAQRDWILDPGSYGQRSTTSCRLPGALVEDFAFTL